MTTRSEKQLWLMDVLQISDKRLDALLKLLDMDLENLYRQVEDHLRHV